MKFSELSRKGDPSHSDAFARLASPSGEKSRLAVEGEAAHGSSVQHAAEVRFSAAAEDVAAPQSVDPLDRTRRLTSHMMSAALLDDLRVQAQHARQRYQLYKAKAYGQRLTSPVRLRDLARAYEQAETRLRAAETTQRRRRATDNSPASPS